MALFNRSNRVRRDQAGRSMLGVAENMVHDADGLTLTKVPSGELIGRLCWADVERATAFKRDLLTTDLVCIEFALSSSTFEINEEIAGWQEVVEQLPEYLHGARPYKSWWSNVMKPAFETRATVIYERGAPEPA